MQVQSKIGVLICYFGEWPWYFDYFIHSCKFNPSIDFLIVTDNDYDKFMPENVKVINKTLDEVKDLASVKLGFQVCLNYAYKLCDLKPAYGIIFSDILKKYDFWAHSDIDVIYGNIRNFMDKEMLDNYDYISVRHDFTTGQFALYRNVFLVNTLFQRSKDYLRVFTSDEHFCFDECNFVHHLLEDGSKSIFELNTQIESFTHVVKSAELNNHIRAHFDFIIIEGIPGRLEFIEGKLVYKNIYEILLYHLIKMKEIYKPIRNPEHIPNIYNISPSRIYVKYKRNLN